MATTHISEAEAARDFEGLMERVRAGEEVLIEKDAATPVLIRSAVEAAGTPISELIERAETRENELGYVPRMDADFAADMEEIIRNRKPRPLSLGVRS